MRDLRKKILLESGKTLSRKARLKPESGFNSPATSPGHSRPGSTANSRAGSRYASEEEDSESDYDENLTISTNSVSDDAADDEREAWADRLRDRVEELQDRKKTSVQGREATLRAYLHLIRHYFAIGEIESPLIDIVTALLKSIRGSSSEEKTLALKALQVTVVTSPSEVVFERTYHALKGTCEDDEDETVKVEAIYALGATVLWGGGGPAAIEEILDFLIEIIESDGHSANAPDSGPVVVAALECWAFLATFLDDLDGQWDAAMEGFMEQVESGDPEVVVNAANNIALVLELWREHGNESKTPDGVTLYQITSRLTEVAKNSTKSVKSMAKKNRKLVKSDLGFVLTSVEQGVGPGYSTARRPDGSIFGYRTGVRIQNVHLRIETYSLQSRVEMLKTILMGGFSTHCAENPILMDLLSAASVEYIDEQGGKGKEKHASKPRDTENGFVRSRLMEQQMVDYD